MKNRIGLIGFTFFASMVSFGQDKNALDIPLSEFNMSNISSPAFVLINESPSEIYVPENLKALIVHTTSNLDGGLSIELSPYYYINTDSKDRSFLKYVGIKEDLGEIKQNPFSGLNTTTISIAYANKEFENLIDNERKVFSVGARTKILRFYNKQGIVDYDRKVSEILQDIQWPSSVLIKASEVETEEERTKIFNDYLETDEGKSNLGTQLEKLEFYKKPIKPIFQVDGAMGYSALFKENNVNSATVNRLGVWLISEFSLILNKDSEKNKYNYYLNAFLVGRYIEDGFIKDERKLYYKDFGGKIEMELGRMSFSYEYISRSGSEKSSRSVGNIKFLVNKDINLTGGFGKDFSSEENLVALFGINWGINF